MWFSNRRTKFKKTSGNFPPKSGGAAAAAVAETAPAALAPQGMGNSTPVANAATAATAANAANAATGTSDGRKRKLTATSDRDAAPQDEELARMTKRLRDMEAETDRLVEDLNAPTPTAVSPPTRPCTRFMLGGYCKFGSRCHFSHCSGPSQSGATETAAPLCHFWNGSVRSVSI